MTTKQTIIDGYTVDLDTNMGEGETGCWISRKGIGPTASLEALMAEGQLQGIDGQIHKVEQSTIDAIEEWADDNGY